MKKVFIIIAFMFSFIASIQANPHLIIKFEKSSFEINESLSFNLQIENNDEPTGYLLSNSTLMALSVDLPMHLYNLENIEINRGIIDSNQKIPPTTSFFILPISTYIGCKKIISISELNLPPGKYRLKIWIPEMRIFDQKIMKKAIKQFNKEPVLSKLEAEADFLITNVLVH